MDARGQLTADRAYDRRGHILTNGPHYSRSLSLSSIHYDKHTLRDPVTWSSTYSTNSGRLEFDPYLEDGAIRLGQIYGNVFEARTLMNVNNNPAGDMVEKVGPEYYPVLHKMLKDKQDWGTELNCRGRVASNARISAWTALVLRDFGDILENAGIFGAIGVSRFSYDYCPNVLRAFYELWGPLANTLHHAAGEMSISLQDLKAIGGLPILGIPYEEFIPENKYLRGDAKYPSTLAELLRIHSDLCIAFGGGYVYLEQWFAHFYRGKDLHNSNDNRRKEKRPVRLDVSKKGGCAAFIAFWLSRFVLPSNSLKVRPETFYMACLMAEGIKVSLAPTVLGYIYHGLGEIATDSRGPGKSRACFPLHYLIGWLGEYFPYLYQRNPDSTHSERYPHLKRYADIEARNLKMDHARIVFRIDSANYWACSWEDRQAGTYMDNGNLSEDQLEMLICIHHALLLVRIAENTWLEQYYPNRFARQFGFDQSVPLKELFLSVPE